MSEIDLALYFENANKPVSREYSVGLKARAAMHAPIGKRPK